MNLHTLQNAGRTFTYTDHAISVPKQATEQMLEILAKWEEAFPYEETYAARTYGVPSLIVRFDGSLTPDGQFNAYEVQSGCGWIGYAGVVNATFRGILDDFTKNRWPPFRLLGPTQPPSNPDEEFWLDRIGLQEAVASDTLLWLRYGQWQIPSEVRDALIARSLKPVRTHNTKRYGVQLGWWKPVVWHESSHGAALPWHEAFVLKPLSGHGSTDIMLWKPNDRTGRATRTQIVHTLQKHGKMYLQRFIPPMSINLDRDRYNVILRPFFGYNPQEKKWTPMHGVWTGRPYPNIRIHGASDAISGPLMTDF